MLVPCRSTCMGIGLQAQGPTYVSETAGASEYFTYSTALPQKSYQDGVRREPVGVDSCREAFVLILSNQDRCQSCKRLVAPKKQK